MNRRRLLGAGAAALVAGEIVVGAVVASKPGAPKPASHSVRIWRCWNPACPEQIGYGHKLMARDAECECARHPADWILGETGHEHEDGGR